MTEDAPESAAPAKRPGPEMDVRPQPPVLPTVARINAPHKDDNDRQQSEPCTVNL